MADSYKYGISLRIFFCSAGDTNAPWRSVRLRFLLLVESRWPLKPLLRLTLPLPVTRNLFIAPRLLLIFGIFTPLRVLLLRHQQHRHVSSFEPRRDVELRDVLHLAHDRIQHIAPELRVGDLAATEEHRYFHSLAALDESADILDFINEVVAVGARSHLDFFDRRNDRFLAALRFLFLLVAEFAVVHHAANRRVRLRRHFDQIHPEALDRLERFVQRHDAQLTAVDADHPHLPGTNLMIDSRLSSYLPPPASRRLDLQASGSALQTQTPNP